MPECSSHLLTKFHSKIFMGLEVNEVQFLNLIFINVFEFLMLLMTVTDGANQLLALKVYELMRIVPYSSY